MRKIKLMQGTSAFIEYIGPKGKKRKEERIVSIIQMEDVLMHQQVFLDANV